MKPQVPLGPTSYCQPFRDTCRKGQQPTQKGRCEPCPKNTVQDVDDHFFLCRPQRNCTAMGLATEEFGSTEKETVCARPPPTPSHPPLSTTHLTTTSVVGVVKLTTKKSTVVVDKEPVPPSVAPVLEAEGGATFTVTHIVVLSVSGVVLLILIVMVTVCARRKGWCGQRGTCQRHCDLESRRYPPNAPRCDNDNASDDSCCACADSCLASPSSSSSTGKGGGGGGKNCGGKSGGGSAHPCKHVPMLEGYMNGKCGGGPMIGGCGGGDHFSEPLYNSISHHHDESKLNGSGGKNLGSGGMMYQNVNGFPPPNMLTQQDFSKSPPPLPPQDFDYNYPSKVQLPSMGSEEEEGGEEGLKKGLCDAGKGGEAGGGGGKGKDREDFTETDPLLPNLEVGSHPPAAPLRGILRNGANRPEAVAARAGGDGREVGGGGGGGGNRPNLSMLLSSVEGSSAQSQEVGVGVGGVAPAANLPYLSQLVSSPHSVQGTPHPPPPPTQPRVQHQQLQQQQATVPSEPPQHVHELPPQLRRHLLQQQQQQQQQQDQHQQEGSTLPLRLLPTTTATATTNTRHPPPLPPPVNTSLVQMDELKPAMSLQPSPTGPTPPPPAPNNTTTTSPSPATAPRGGGGAANVSEGKDRGSPARINPSQQKEVRGGGNGRDSNSGRKKMTTETSDTKPPTEVGEEKDREGGAGLERQQQQQQQRGQGGLDDETLRKEALPVASSPVGEEEETTRKSVGGSSGLGESLDLSSPLSLPSEDGRRSRSLYRRSNSEASRSVSPQLPLPPSRSISSPGDKNRPYAVVKPMQSDQSLDALSSSPDHVTELTRPLDSAGQQYPLQSFRSGSPHRLSSQDSSDEPDEAENA
ncbi:uncharacterized protein LOC143301854 [Babylonia areolata]|uniref:uncharacterized protein LOC143301854 n=1 Tax=Babylonia areolata TaxID=304850 RepID=UPI003FD65D8F